MQVADNGDWVSNYIAPLRKMIKFRTFCNFLFNKVLANTFLHFKVPPEQSSPEHHSEEEHLQQEKHEIVPAPRFQISDDVNYICNIDKSISYVYDCQRNTMHLYHLVEF